MITEKMVLDALPARSLNSFITDYVDYAMMCTDAHCFYHVAGALALLTQCAPANLGVDVGVEAYANLFMLLVGKSTVSRKSKAIELARKVLREVDPKAECEPPGSDEALRDALRDRQRQILIYSEFGSFLASTEKNYKTSIKPTMNELWDCTPIGRQLVKRKAGLIEHPRLSIVAGCAPGYLERHTELVDWQDGFFARWMIFYGLPERSYPAPETRPREKAMLVARLRQKMEHFAQAGSVGPCLGFTPEARVMWNDFYAQIQALSVKEDQNGAALNRAPANALKVALLLSLDYGEARTGAPWHITPDVLGPALKFTAFSIECMRKVVSEIAPTLTMIDRREVLRAVSYKHPTALGVITRKAKLLMRPTLAILETLVEEGEIIRCASELTEGGKGSLCYMRVNTDELVLRQEAAEAAGPRPQLVIVPQGAIDPTSDDVEAPTVVDLFGDGEADLGKR